MLCGKHSQKEGKWLSKMQNVHQHLQYMRVTWHCAILRTVQTNK